MQLRFGFCLNKYADRLVNTSTSQPTQYMPYLNIGFTILTVLTSTLVRRNHAAIRIL